MSSWLLFQVEYLADGITLDQEVLMVVYQKVLLLSHSLGVLPIILDLSHLVLWSLLSWNYWGWSWMPLLRMLGLRVIVSFPLFCLSPRHIYTLIGWIEANSQWSDPFSLAVYVFQLYWTTSLANDQASCCVGCLQYLVEFFNKYAYIEICASPFSLLRFKMGVDWSIALYGKAYIPAAKDTWRLMKDRGIDALVNDSLVGTGTFRLFLRIHSTSSVFQGLVIAVVVTWQTLWEDS